MNLRLLPLALLVASLVACGAESASRRTDGLDQNVLPEGIRADYQVFADRCSKCHSLTRPLNSGIDNDEYWATYVERMRRQPASGISREDVPAILRFLHFYVLQEREAKDKRAPVSSRAPAASTSSEPAAPGSAAPSTLTPAASNSTPGTSAADGGF